MMFKLATAWASLILAMAFTLAVTFFGAPASRHPATFAAKVSVVSAWSGPAAGTVADRIPVDP